MIPSSYDQILQFIAWFLALAEFVLALYILLLNVWHSANRHVGALFLTIAANNFALGLMTVSTNASQATLPAQILSATSPAVQPALLIITIVLLKPHWLRGRWRRAWWLVYGIYLLPILLTLLDVGLGTRLWYTGLNPETYPGGYVSLREFAAGDLSQFVWVLNFYIASTVTVIPLLYVTLRDKTATPMTRRLAGLLLGAQITVLFIQFGLRGILDPATRTLVTGTFFVFIYAYAAFQQMISERRLQRGQLQTRLTALILAVTAPLLVVVVVFVNARAGALVQQAARQQQDSELLSALGQFQIISWAALALGVVLLLVLVWLTIRQALRPIGALTDTVAAITAGDLTPVAPVESEDEIGTLARAFNSMTGQLRELIGSLEQQVQERTRDLAHRTAYLEAAAEVGRAATSILETDQLTQQVVELIRGRFELYYVGLFLVDEPGEWAVLQAGTGQAGRAMLARGHRIHVGQGMIGWSIANAQARVAQDVQDAGEDAARLATAELPDTRSEAALPLRSRGRVIGALSVQDTRPGAFDQDTIAVLQTMADQVAVALDNARLFAESQAAAEASSRAFGQLSRQAWTNLLRSRSDWGYLYHQRSVAPLEGDWYPEMLQAIQAGQSVQRENGVEPTLAIPLQVRGQVIGALSFRKAEGGEGWTDQEIELLQTLTERLGQALESARLYHDTQRRATREQLTSEITSRMRETLDVDAVLQTAVREMRKALGIAKVEVRLDPTQTKKGNTK